MAQLPAYGEPPLEEINPPLQSVSAPVPGLIASGPSAVRAFKHCLFPASVFAAGHRRRSPPA